LLIISNQVYNYNNYESTALNDFSIIFLLLIGINTIYELIGDPAPNTVEGVFFKLILISKGFKSKINILICDLRKTIIIVKYFVFINEWKMYSLREHNEFEFRFLDGGYMDIVF
jgi:hypothetical protein